MNDFNSNSFAEDQPHIIYIKQETSIFQKFLYVLGSLVTLLLVGILLLIASANIRHYVQRSRSQGTRYAVYHKKIDAQWTFAKSRATLNLMFCTYVVVLIVGLLWGGVPLVAWPFIVLGFVIVLFNTEDNRYKLGKEHTSQSEFGQPEDRAIWVMKHKSQLKQDFAKDCLNKDVSLEKQQQFYRILDTKDFNKQYDSYAAHFKATYGGALVRADWLGHVDILRLAITEFNLLLDQLGLGKLHLPVPNMFQTPLWAQVLSGVCLFLSGVLIYVTFLFAMFMVGMIIAKAGLIILEGVEQILRRVVASLQRATKKIKNVIWRKRRRSFF